MASEVSVEREDDRAARQALLRSSIIERVKDIYGAAKDRLQIALPILEILPLETDLAWYSIYEILDKAKFSKEESVHTVQKELYLLMGMGNLRTNVVAFRRERSENQSKPTFRYAIRTNPNFDSGAEDLD